MVDYKGHELEAGEKITAADIRGCLKKHNLEIRQEMHCLFALAGYIGSGMTLKSLHQGYLELRRMRLVGFTANT